MRNIFKRNSPTQDTMPEVETSDFPPQPTYVVAGDYQEFRMYKRVRGIKDAVWVVDVSHIRGVRQANIVFTGSWNETTNGSDLWEYASAGGNNVQEDLIL